MDWTDCKAAAVARRIYHSRAPGGSWRIAGGRGMNIYGAKAHVVIVGGGFAGLACARKLAKSDDVRVTLIDKNNYHQFQPLFYQLATAELGTGDVSTSIRRSLRGYTNVDVKMLEVTAADPKTRTVSSREGESYQGDF